MFRILRAAFARHHSHDRRIAKLETELRALGVALALMPYAKAAIDKPRVPTPRPAHAAEVPLFPHRRPKAEGHL